MTAETPAVNLDPSSWPEPPRRPNRDSRPPRCYCLSAAGLAALQAAAASVRPWSKSTGPRTPAGKAVSRYNRLQHGRRSAEAVERRRLFTAAMRHCNRCVAEHDRSMIAAFTIVDLGRLLKIPDEANLSAMTEAEFTAAAELVGVKIEDLDRWMSRRLKAKTLAGALRFAPPRPKKRPPPRPLDVVIEFVDAPDFWK